MKAFFRIAAVDEPYMGGSSASMEIEVFPTLECLEKIVGKIGLGDSRTVVVHGDLKKLAAIDDNFLWKPVFAHGVYQYHQEWCKKFDALKTKLQHEWHERKKQGERAKAKKKRGKR